MTIDERIEKLEHVTALHIEQARRDYEENLRIQRDLSSHIDAIWKGMERRDQERSQEWTEMKQRHDQEWAEMKKTIAERDRITDERIGNLVSAIGKLIERLDGPVSPPAGNR